MWCSDASDTNINFECLLLCGHATACQTPAFQNHMSKIHLLLRIAELQKKKQKKAPSKKSPSKVTKMESIWGLQIRIREKESRDSAFGWGYEWDFT